MSKLLGIRVKDETAAALYALAIQMSRAPGRQLDVIIADYLSRYASPVTPSAAAGSGAADGSSNDA